MSFTFSKVYSLQCLNVASIPLVGTGNSSDGSYPQGFSCNQLYGQIVSSFDQNSIWGGDRLQTEYNYTYGQCCECSNTCTLPRIAISSCSDLQSISLDLLAEYALTQNVDCTGFEFTPISNFEGKLDGQGFAIKNLNLKNSSSIFSSALSATLTNLTLLNIFISAPTVDSVGPLFSSCTGCSISFITVNTTSSSIVNSITGNYDVGGIGLTFNFLSHFDNLT